jgi:hypothetical protein
MEMRPRTLVLKEGVADNPMFDPMTTVITNVRARLPC